MRPLLLDTCAVIFISEGEKLAVSAMDALDAAHRGSVSTYICPITAWEVGLLASRKRVQLATTPQRWFARLLDAPGVQLANMSPDLLIASSFLPGTPPSDPVDRIILATARDLGCTLMTRDRALLEYGEQGHVKVVGC